MKGREYKPEKGDIAFFLCPPNKITKNARQILDDNNIALYEYSSLNVEELLKISAPKIEVGEEVSTEVESKPEEEFIIVKEPKYSLEDIPGIAKTRAKQLKDVGIRTIKDLIYCNSNITAQKIKGVGKVSLDKWKQAARQISSG